MSSHRKKLKAALVFPSETFSYTSAIREKKLGFSLAAWRIRSVAALSSRKSLCRTIPPRSRGSPPSPDAEEACCRQLKERNQGGLLSTLRGLKGTCRYHRTKAHSTHRVSTSSSSKLYLACWGCNFEILTYPQLPKRILEFNLRKSISTQTLSRHCAHGPWAVEVWYASGPAIYPVQTHARTPHISYIYHTFILAMHIKLEHQLAGTVIC